ncbi:FAD:protein FMN transferase [Tepidicaulis sp.]|uniref:FAD:protein FMN transferase n=1 Tax=Tepidicaulis sp. TaxID=1920809 RepID=UPI003B5992CA
MSDAEAARLQALALTEIARLEEIFSLYKESSALQRLNREGTLENAPRELTELLRETRYIHEATGGAFDPSVQTYWDVLASHYGAGADEDSAAEALAEATRHTGFARVKIKGARIVLPRAMKLTLNGIAQGYITDKVAERLSREGARHVLVNLGEFRPTGPKDDGSDWQIGLADPAAPYRIADSTPLRTRALATSAPYSASFDRDGKRHHLLDPATGQSSARYASLSVKARDATAADGFSTAFSLMREEQIARVIERAHDPDIGVHLTRQDGTVRVLGNWIRA